MATLAEHALDVTPERSSKPRKPVSRKGITRSRALLAQSGAVIQNTARQIFEGELLVDLGDSIGSARWWRGLATFTALSGAAFSLGFNMPELVGHVTATPSESVQAEYRQLGIAPLSAHSETAPRAAPTSMARRLSETPERPRLELTSKIGSGGLDGALRRAGIGRDDLARVRSLLSGVVRGAGGMPGTDVEVILGRRESRSDPRPLEYLAFRASFENKVQIDRSPAGELRIKTIPIKIDNTPLRITGLIGSSFERSARAAGIPSSIIGEYRRQMGFALDWQRDVKSRDKFEMIIAHRRAETGETEMGGLLYAGLINGRSNVSLMRYGRSGEFFWPNGEAVRKGLIRSPVNGARMSSGFGLRFHPVLGYSRMHQGVDFAARTGTPIQASASGTVVSAGWGGGYGNLVVIDHGKGMRTRYAHMSKIGVKAGQKVTQGQTIGAVGSTGLSTGPHLHYEVWQNGKAVNPRDAKFTGGNQLSGKDLGNFKAELGRLKTIPLTNAAS